MFLDHIFFDPPDGRRPDGQGKNIMTLQLRWAGHNKNTKKPKYMKSFPLNLPSVDPIVKLTIHRVYNLSSILNRSFSNHSRLNLLPYTFEALFYDVFFRTFHNKLLNVFTTYEMLVQHRLLHYNTASYHITLKNCSLSLISSYRTIKLKLMIMPDNYICTNVYYVSQTLVNRAYVGQATLKDNKVVKTFRAYDIHKYTYAHICIESGT